MPLIQGKSNKSLKKNVETEMDSGKPQKQSLAIAFSVQRKNKKKKYAKGGEVTAPEEKEATADNSTDEREFEMGKAKAGAQEQDLRDESKPDADKSKDKRELDMTDDHAKSHGQEVDLRDEKYTTIDDASDEQEKKMLDSHPTRHAQELTANDEDEKPSSIVEAIIHKRRMAEGGMVDIEENAEDAPNGLEALNERAVHGLEGSEREEFSKAGQPEDSNEHGDKLSDEDEHNASMIASIMRKMRSNRQ